MIPQQSVPEVLSLHTCVYTPGNNGAVALTGVPFSTHKHRSILPFTFGSEGNLLSLDGPETAVMPLIPGTKHESHKTKEIST